MTNREIYDIVNAALTPQYIVSKKRHTRLDINLRIDDRDIRIMSDYRHTEYVVIDAETGEVIGIQPVEDSLMEVDKAWWNKKCETYYGG